MFATTIGHCWRTLFAASKWHVTEARRLSLAGIEASWLPESRKCELRREFGETLAALEAALDPADRELDLAIERPPPQWP
jgi:adenosine deaminase